ncbi:hypothetical protein BD94_2555 [Elizabethkingia anophelis NUHP1]|uniref:Uncharacterized protein n=1 Tax=Elizabethkingia anophelis NUHP1 TaxID=1338011 RepID=A0A077ELI6_9FLAO|nr:hypothetical protein BD94_2555 [Elizabethkingia anophelis NUHP1]CDN73168.1 hypothetical protein E18064_170070 [Elizabethkingia anophelis]CDN79305.1 hypothetical protein E27107_50070 [Elizabethkingia anophelis]
MHYNKEKSIKEFYYLYSAYNYETSGVPEELYLNIVMEVNINLKIKTA